MARPIVDTLRAIRRGEFLDEASEQLAELVDAVQTTGKPGKIILTIDVRKATEAGRALLIDGVSTIKKPALGREATIMFPADDGSLVVQDPRQQNLDLKTVPSSPPLGDAVSA